MCLGYLWLYFRINKYFFGFFGLGDNFFYNWGVFVVVDLFLCVRKMDDGVDSWGRIKD